jgi:hypothetical protein
MYHSIFNPESGRKVSIYKKKGQVILRKYVQQLGGNADDFPEICAVPGPCWKGYVYIGPKPHVKGSCIKKSKLCKKTRGKGTQCKSIINCTDLSPPKKIAEDTIAEYDKCLITAHKRYETGDLNLCPQGYCTAKHKFEVYPSAYANGYASQVCTGKKPNLKGKKQGNVSYLAKLGKKTQDKNKGLQRWFNEQWVNVCESGEGPGGYAICGSGKGLDNPKQYPYCRAYYKYPGTTVVTAPELTSEEIDTMCKKKRSLEQGIDGKPTRIFLPKKPRNRVQKKRLQNKK